MKSLNQQIQEIIDTMPFVRESLSEGLINTSALARKIKPLLENANQKTIKDSTIIMSISRLPFSKQQSIQSKIKKVINNFLDFIFGHNRSWSIYFI